MKEQFQVDMIDKIIDKTNKQTKRNNDVLYVLLYISVLSKQVCH